MEKKEFKVMLSPKSNENVNNQANMDKMVKNYVLSLQKNYVPTKETVNFDATYHYDNTEAIKMFSSVVDGVDLNRKLKEKHVKEIYNEIANKTNKDLPKTFSGKYIADIRVDINTFTVVDGNNTLAAYKKAWGEGYEAELKVKYVDINKEYLSLIIVIINNTQVSWNIKDYFEQKVNLGNNATNMLNAFARTHSLCIKSTNKKTGEEKISIRTASCCILGKNIEKMIKTGELEITDEDIKFGDMIHNEVSQMISKLGFYRNNWTESFISAWYSIRKKPMYRDAIEEIGFDTLIYYMDSSFNGVSPTPRKAYWENKFDNAIWVTKENIKHNIWKKVA